MGERDTGIGSTTRRRGNAGYDLVAMAGRLQCFGFFTTATENEGIATL